MPTPKQDAILQTGRVLFLRHGMRKVRVEEICGDARVSKRTFYKYFRNKDDLAVRVLGQLFEEARARVEAVLCRDCPIEDKARQVIAVKSELASKTSAAFYRETMDAQTEPGRFALLQQRKWDERVRGFYRDSQARGEIHTDIDIDLLMALLVRMRAFVSDPELMRHAPDFSRLVEAVMKMLFYGIVPRPEAKPRMAAERRRRKKR